MLARLIGAATAALLLVGLLAGAVLAAEEEDGAPHGPLPSIEEIGTQSEVSQQFFPEEGDDPPFTAALVYPLLAIGLLAALVILTLYLRWQPNFEDERRRASRRR